jgi:hypothetical protein
MEATMFKHFVFRGVVALVLLVALAAGAAGVGLLAYNAGLVHGLAQNGQAGLPPAGAAPYPYWGGPFYRVGFFGPGLGLLSCLLLFLGFGFIFTLVRGLLWGGMYGMWRRPWHRAWGGPGAQAAWEKGYPPMFEEWHRRAHGQGEPSTPPPSESGQA